MKKLMTVAATALCASVFANTPVESSNIVGYQTITLPEGQEYGMYALPFDAVTSEDGMTLYDVFPNPLESFTGGTVAALADQIMFWDNGAYRSLYLFKNDKVPARHGKWINPAVIPNSSWGAVNQPTQLKLKGGTSFWIKRKTTAGETLPAKTVVVSGSVITKANGVASYAITPATADAGAYTLVAAGFSAPFIPNPDLQTPAQPAIDWLAMGCTGGTVAALADQLMFWDKGAYRSLYLFKNDKVPARHNKWINPAVIPDATWGAVNQPSKVVIEPTVGFWYYRTKGATAELNFQIQQPYSL
jgi:hypothetical protein